MSCVQRPESINSEFMGKTFQADTYQKNILQEWSNGQKSLVC